ncbi:putative Glycosyl transferase family 1 [Candidatus Magnetomoraceae bacterium gMMP-1]
MGKKLKIAIISHALVVSVNQNRWKRLAEDKNYEVHLLVPKYWETEWFGKNEKKIFEPKELHDNNFYVHPLPTTSVKSWGRYLFRSFDAKFRKIKPDLIYIIHEESILIHHQIYLYRKLFAPKARIIFFSMNARGIPYQKTKHPLRKLVYKWMWENIKKNTEAALVHYPGCVDSLRSGDYKKPIYMQTQVGVDEILFAPKKDKRDEYRKKIDFEDKFIIGYTGRLTVDKGVDDLVAVFIELAKENNNLSLLLVGNGNLKGELEQIFKKENLKNKVHITGFIDQAEVPNYMNAMDIFVLGSKTMPHWLDTFPLVTVQAQAVGVPVIASNSASIPWQLADSAKIFAEGDRNELKQALISFIVDKELRNKYAIKGQKRSYANFCHIGMTKNFKKILEQVMCGEFIYHKKDEPYTQWKAY